MPGEITPTLRLPLSHSDLEFAILASGRQGFFQLRSSQYSFLVPSGTMVVVTWSVDPGYVSVMTTPIRFTSSHYSPDIDLNFRFFGRTTVFYHGCTLAQPVELDFRQSQFAQTPTEQEMEALIDNASSYDAMVTVTYMSVLIEKSIYDSVIVPMVRANYPLLQALSEAVQKVEWKVK